MDAGLRELYTTHNPLKIELFARMCRWLYGKVYKEGIAVGTMRTSSTSLLRTPSTT